jgi:hypothetical protein
MVVASIFRYGMLNGGFEFIVWRTEEAKANFLGVDKHGG